MPGGFHQPHKHMLEEVVHVVFEWLFGQFVGFLQWLSDQIGALVPPVPPQVSSLISGIGRIVSAASQVGAWFPIELVAPVLLIQVGAWVAGMAIKVARIVASFMTIGGGSAG